MYGSRSFKRILAIIGILLTTLGLGALGVDVPPPIYAHAPRAMNASLKKPSPWQMFHRDEQHTGVAKGVGDINPATGPHVRWKFKETKAPTQAEFLNDRWYSSLPLGDLDGDGKLDIVVPSYDGKVWALSGT